MIQWCCFCGSGLGVLCGEAPMVKQKKTTRFILSSLLVSVCGGVLLSIWSYYCYGDIFSGVERLRGRTVLVRNVRIDVDTVDDESNLTHFSLEIKNLTSKPVRVVGASASCSCTHFYGIPVTLQAYKTTELGGSLHWKEEMKGGFKYTVLVYLDSGVSPVAFVIEG